MLEQIRDATKGWFAWVLIGALAMVFALWGVFGYMGVTSSEAQMAATVNGTDISRAAVDRLAQQLQQQQAAAGQTPSVEAVREQALNQFILQTLLVQDAQRLGFTADKQLVDKYILQQPEFQLDGKFSPEVFEQITRQSGYGPYELRELIADEIIVEQLRAGIMGSAFALPNEVDRFLVMQNETRDVQYVTFPVDYFVTLRDIPDEEVQKYYQTHQSQWETPEQVSIEYIELTADDASKDINVTDAEVRTYYDENLASYTTPEQRHVRHILLLLPENATTQQMDEVITRGLVIKEQIESGVDFAKLAKEYSVDTTTSDKGGDLGWVTAGILPPELDKVVFAADAGKVLDPQLTPFGVDIAQVIAIKPPETQPLAEVQTEIADQLRKQRTQQRFIELQDELATLSYEMPDSLVEVADTMKMPLKTSAAFTQDKGAGDAVTQNAEVRNVAFSDTVMGGENSPVITLGPEHIVVLRIKEHQPRAAKPLEVVRPDVIKAIQDDEATAKMRTSLNEWVAELKTGKLSTTEVADRVGGTPWKTTTKLSRTADAKMAPQLVRDYAFNLPSPQPPELSAGWLPLSPTEFALVLVTKVNAGTPPTPDTDEWKNTSAGLTRMQQQNDYMQYLAQLRENADVKMH